MMSAFYSLVIAALNPLPVLGLSLVEPIFDLLAELSLIALKSQHILSFALLDLGRNLPLAG